MRYPFGNIRQWPLRLAGPLATAGFLVAPFQSASAGILESAARALPGTFGADAMKTVRRICRGGGPKPPSGISKNARTFGQLDCANLVKEPISVFKLEVAPVCARFNGSEVWAFKIGKVEMACCMKRHQGLTAMASSICLPANRG